MKGRILILEMPKPSGAMAALMVDGRLEDLLIDPPRARDFKGFGDDEQRHDTTPCPGEIYWAKPDRAVPKMHGAFVRLGPDAQGFLRDAKGLHDGAGILVQVTSFAEPGKATPVATRLLFKSRRVIYTPDAPGINVSRQIREPDERARLEAVAGAIAAECEPLKGLPGGWILRTAARGTEHQCLQIEMLALAETTAAPTGKVPGTGHRIGPGRSAYWQALTEWTWPVPDRIVGSRHTCSVSANFEIDAHLAEPALNEALLDHDDGDPFDHFGVLDEIEHLKSPRAELPSGAWMAVEATRAMVTVDVNTGGAFNPAAALTANLEAARELPRQLRLRGLGGQVAIDFAPLRKMDRKHIEEALKAAFRKDPIETSLAGWTPLGNFELQRKRERRPLTELAG